MDVMLLVLCIFGIVGGIVSLVNREWKTAFLVWSLTLLVFICGVFLPNVQSFTKAEITVTVEKGEYKEFIAPEIYIVKMDYPIGVFQQISETHRVFVGTDLGLLSAKVNEQLSKDKLPSIAPLTSTSITVNNTILAQRTER